MNYVIRVNLKTACSDRPRLIDFCLNDNPSEQYLAIGWSYVYDNNPQIRSYEGYYYAVKESVKRVNSVLNRFYDAKEGDLFWTRDLEGFYWVCRAKEGAKPFYDKEQDIGALLPVNAYKFGLEVPGQIKASFNRQNGGTAERIYDKAIIEFTKKAYNDLSKSKTYKIDKVTAQDVLSNLPAFDLEELVIAYIQIKHNYYVLSNSIANKSTTIKIECEFISRDVKNPSRAVVQVKGPKATLDATAFLPYLERGYQVFLYAKEIFNADCNKNVVVISEEELRKFYYEYKVIFPESITQWECLI